MLPLNFKIKTELNYLSGIKFDIGFMINTKQSIYEGFEQNIKVLILLIFHVFK